MPSSSVRCPSGALPDFDRARDAVEDALPARAEKLQSESWAYAGDLITHPRGEQVQIPALDVLREDLDALEQAMDTPPEGFEARDEADGAVVWHFPDTHEGRRLRDGAERLRDFDLLSPAGLELV